jgi:drug/metabolite transporter (DMT)-like permease
VAPAWIAACLLFSVSLAGGQVLFKLAADDISANRAAGLLPALVSPWLAAALILYAFATALWVWVLMHVPLNRAYPFAIIAMALVPLASHWLFGEVLSARYLAGLALMLAGLALVQSA